MEFRSSNSKYVHFGGDILSNVDDGSSYGVHLTGGSTAGIVTAAGDTTNINLIVQGKGAGGVQIGSSGNAIKDARMFTVQFTAPALSSGAATASVESTHTVSGVSTGTVLIFTPTNPIHSRYNVRPRCSTANELTLAWGLAASGVSSVGTGESTNRGVLLQFRF